MVTLSPEQRKEQIWSVIRVSSGNFLEMYDFFVFGYYASAIGKVFFPTGSDFAQLMLAFMTFGAGFLMRPLGGIFLGAYIDHYGRRAGLMLTLALMAVGTLSIALVPGYATLGALAPVINGWCPRRHSRGSSPSNCGYLSFTPAIMERWLSP
jgi:MHS family citrate/tricarballylate:H+ symporter-like MFS transporter